MTTAWKKNSNKKTSLKTNKFWSKKDWLIFIMSIVIIIGSLFFWQFWSSYQNFLGRAGLSTNEILTLYHESQKVTIRNDNNKVNFLLLGTDVLEYREAEHPLTDTIILASLNLEDGKVNVLPIPRDIYLANFSNKINAVYASFYARDPQTALAQTTQTIADFFQIPIHYSGVVNLIDIQDFLELLGGIDVEIVNSFTDYKFPKSGVDIRVVNDPSLLYETVSFASGAAHLNPELTLKFMRSRHSTGIEGSDYSRSARQQLVIGATANKLLITLKKQIQNFDLTFLGQLYKFYQDKFESQVPFTELLAIGQHYLNNGKKLEVNNQKLNIAPADLSAALKEVDPSGSTNQMWAIRVLDQKALQKEVQEKLNLL